MAEQTPDLHLSPDMMQGSQGKELGQGGSGEGERGGGRQAMNRRPSTPNASSAPITEADSVYTHGTVNQHPSLSNDERPSFRVGVSEDRNRKCRRTMEDAHAFVYDYGGVKGQGYFAVFDGHAGKQSAEWCGTHFHKYLLRQLREGQASQPIPDLLNATFHVVDGELSKLAAAGGTHSGCTAVTAFLRLEDENGRAVELHGEENGKIGSQVAQGGAGSGAAASTGPEESGLTEAEKEEKKRWIGDGVHREKLKSMLSSSNTSTTSSADPNSSDTPSSTHATGSSEKAPSAALDNEKSAASPAYPKSVAKRTLYTANVGDARAVLCRGGKAVRLTYDHKGSDAQEAKRITDAGGFVMNNRVNGVLAVTRSLGDSSMKEFVVGSPYTTETTLGDDDTFLIIACDGLWDVCEDQMAVDLIRDLKDPQDASKVLLDHALQNFSTDNLSVLVVSLDGAGAGR